MRNLISLLLASLLSFTSMACTGADEPAPVDDAGLAANEEELSSCGSAKYAEALAHYKNAVAWSKDRLARGVCESDNGLQWQIADEASRAVMTCDHFRSILRTSVYAAPVRQALAPSLTLRSLSGELSVIRDSSWQNWTGVESFFSKGLTFWSLGELGPLVRLEFQAGGKAVWNEQLFDAATSAVTWKQTQATYTIVKTGKDKDLRKVIVVHEGQTENLTLKVKNPAETSGAPLFVLESPATPEGAIFRLQSLIGECEA